MNTRFSFRSAHLCYALLSVFLWLSLPLSATTVTYTADKTTNFSNPERGFYEQIEQKLTSSGTTNLSSSYFTRANAAGRSLILRLYYLDNFRTSALPQAVLNQITSDMALLRTHGMKCILRFAYTASASETASKNQDASPAMWQQHLSQLKPILAANADVIYVVQAGFLGAWGEWYYSSQGVGNAIAGSVKTNLINWLLDAVPQNRFVQLRTPKYKTDYLGDTVALTAATAYTTTSRARLGYHNDAFCNGADNMGTYTNVKTEKSYLARETLFVPNGGETNIESEHAANYKNYGTGAKALSEMQLVHISYLGYEYSEYATDQWKTETNADGESYYDLMARLMGYRFELMDATFPATAVVAGTLPVTIRIQNVGCAPLYNERHAYLVLSSSSNTYTLPLSADPRSWHPGQTVTVSETLSLPSAIVPGTYSLSLSLPDADSRLASNSAFSVRMANQNTWDAATGYNSLNATVQVASSPSPTESYTLSFDDNRPSAWDNRFLLTPSGLSAVSVDAGQPYTIPAAEPSIGEQSAPSYHIYLFTGWNTRKDGTGTTYHAGDVLTPSSDLVLYAQWQGRAFSITYYSDSSQSSVLALSPDSYTFDSEVVFPIPVRSGYEFVAWHSVYGDEVVTSTAGYWGDFELWAEWKSVPSSLQNPEPLPKVARKILRDGTLLIRRNAQLFTLLGQPYE